MSKRIFKLWGLVLSVMLIASMLIPVAPAQALYGQAQWLSQPIPSSNGKVLLAGSDVTDIAIVTGAIYAVDNGTASGIAYRSTDGGQSFTSLTVVSGAGRLKKISVAPDNTNVVAVTDGVKVYSSTDAGSTWSDLGGPASANVTIMDLAVAPARSGTLFGREYVIAVANLNSANTEGGDVLIIGEQSTWASVGPTGTGYITDTRDYVAVAVTPNFVGDRAVVALGASRTAGTASTNGTVVQVFNTALKTVITTAYLASGSTATTTDVGTLATGIVGGSIALPSDFDATTSSGRRAYVGIASNPTATGQPDNDVYRVDDNAARALGAVTTQGVWSVSYAGTVSGGGTLLMGRLNTAEVKYTTDMTSNSPTWTASKKLMPTTTLVNIIVMAAPDFATSKTVYLGSSGAESALSVSVDGGITFDQLSLIDIVSAGTANTLYKLIGLAFTPDGKTAYMMSASASPITAGTPVNANISLWKGPAPTSDTTWKRIGVWNQTAATSTSVAFLTLAPDYATTSTVYVIDLVTSGAIYRSSDGGATWNNRNLPTGINLAAAFALSDANTFYIADNISGNIYKSTNGAFTWSGAVSPNAGAVTSIVIGKTADQVFVGGTGYMSVSNDGGTTFTQIPLDSGIKYRISKDTAFTTNSVLYMADSAGTGVYKFIYGTDSKPTNISAPGAGTSTIGVITTRAGALYVGYASGRWDRTVNPQDVPGTITWKSLPTTGLAAGAYTQTTTKDVNSILYTRNYFNGAPAVYAWEDYLATAIPVIISPSANATLRVDPNTGYAQLFNIVLQPMGSGTGLVTHFDMEIAEQAVGFAGANRASQQLTPTNLSGGIPVSQPNAPSFAIPGQFTPTLQSNTVYIYRVRAWNEVAWSGQTPVVPGMDSPWSATQTLYVGSGGQIIGTQFGPSLLGPVGGATGVSLTPGFAWAPVYGATSYQFKLATDAALTQTVASVTTTLPSYQATTPLKANTTYFWSVQAITPAEGPISVGTFTTAAPVVTAPPPSITMPPITITSPPISIPPYPTPTFTIPPSPAPAPTITPAFIWAVIIIGAILVIAVIVLIVRTRRTP